MHYFKNVELAKLHGVSEGAVRRWIESARQKKIDLQLYENQGRFHIANTVKNQKLMEALASRGKKYSSPRWHKTVKPTPAFYKLYDNGEVADIIRNISIYREVPQQYSYFGSGASWWNDYAFRLWKEEEENSLTASVDLLRSNAGNLIRLLKGYDTVNVIDLGVGNGLAVKELLTKLFFDEALLGRYIGVDISKDMLKIAEQNLNQWFNGAIAFEGSVRDITYQRFSDLLVHENTGTTANLVLLLGGTLSNFRLPEEVLQTIRHSMGDNALFVTSSKLDSEETRRYFDFSTQEDHSKLAPDHKKMLEHLGIDESFYESEHGYDSTHRMRFSQVRFKVGVTIEFKIDGKKHPVDLSKGDAILLWRAWHQSPLDVVNQLSQNGFALREVSINSDENYILTVSQIRKESRTGFKAA